MLSESLREPKGHWRLLKGGTPGRFLQPRPGPNPGCVQEGARQDLMLTCILSRAAITTASWEAHPTQTSEGASRWQPQGIRSGVVCPPEHPTGHGSAAFPGTAHVLPYPAACKLTPPTPQSPTGDTRTWQVSSRSWAPKDERPPRKDAPYIVSPEGPEKHQVSF